MVGLCCVSATYCIAVHDHVEPRRGLPYQKIRNKPFPWSCSDCDLFDLKCWDACKAAKAGKQESGGHGH